MVLRVASVWYSLWREDFKISMSEGMTGKYAAFLKPYLRGIMYGREDHEWGLVVTNGSGTLHDCNFEGLVSLTQTALKEPL